MSDSLIGLFLLLLLAGGAYCAWRWREAEGRLAAHAGAAAEARVRLEQIGTLVAERDAARSEARTLAAQLAGVEAAGRARAEAFAEKEATLHALRGEVEKTFSGLAVQALASSEQRFLTLANETFEKHKAAAQGGVREVVAPVQEHFVKLTEAIAALDKSRTQDKSALSEQMRQIAESMSQTQAVTGRLANALRAAPKTRGRWGEETLRNVLELSGLSARVDFVTEQTSEDGEGGRVRPDVIIRLPGKRAIVVDSKVALSGYLDAMEATDEAAREAHLRKHAGELRAHMAQLGSKEYWRHVPDTADFVIMFVPGDNFLAAAFERDPTLYQDGFARKVVVIGPSNLFALAKTIAFGWRQEEIAANAEEIAKLGRELYARLLPLSKHLAVVGETIAKSVHAYNGFVSSFDTRVLVTARKFKGLGVAESGAELGEPAIVEAAPRLPAPQAELDLAPEKLRRR